MARSSIDHRQNLTRPRGDYGVDAPHVLAALGVAGAAEVGVSGVFLLLSAAWHLFATRRGKFAVWADILNDLDLRGDERVLDLG